MGRYSFFHIGPGFFPLQDFKTLQNITHHFTYLFDDFDLKNIIQFVVGITIPPKLRNGKVFSVMAVFLIPFSPVRKSISTLDFYRQGTVLHMHIYPY